MKLKLNDLIWLALRIRTQRTRLTSYLCLLALAGAVNAPAAAPGHNLSQRFSTRAGSTLLPAGLAQAIQQTLGETASTQSAAYGQQQELTASDGASSNGFGFSVALSSDGHTALIGAPVKNSNQGAVYVFREQANTWTEQQELTAGGGMSLDEFGASVALSSDGQVALIGAYGKNSFQGAAYVFTEQANAWTQEQELTAPDGASQNYFGVSVALSSDGHTALIGAPVKNSFQGASYVFTEQGNTWTEQQELTAGDGASGDEFGVSVALSSAGHTALIGANRKNSFQGAAYVFTEQANTWTEQQELMAGDGAVGDEFGGSVALSGDGHVALVAASGTNFAQGAAYVFAEQANTWTER